MGHDRLEINSTSRFNHNQHSLTSAHRVGHLIQEKSRYQTATDFRRLRRGLKDTTGSFTTPTQIRFAATNYEILLYENNNNNYSEFYSPERT